MAGQVIKEIGETEAVMKHAPSACAGLRATGGEGVQKSTKTGTEGRAGQEWRVRMGRGGAG